jgi:hypothetical protein
MASRAQLGLILYQQVLFFLGVMGRVAVEAAMSLLACADSAKLDC